MNKRTSPRFGEPRENPFQVTALRLLSVPLATCLLVSSPVAGAEPVEIGNRLELFVDDHLVELMEGTQWRLHAPVDRGTVWTREKAWETPYTGYASVIQDGGIYRLYYRGSGSMTDGAYCYAESPDGITWTRPSLGLHEFKGSKENNIILKGRDGGHSFSPFLDANPDAVPGARYKALGLRRTADDKDWELVAFASPDGIHWNLLRREPVMTEGAFDSQNVAFWSETEKKYVCYYRTKSNGRTGLRQISRAVSDDFIHWSEGRLMEFRRFGEPVAFEQMYINQTQPYFRAPHLYIATAARFMQGRQAVSEERAKEFVKGNFRDCSDAVLMTTRGGHHYERTFMEGWVRPGIGLENWGTRTNYPALGIVPAGENEMSLYVVRAYGHQDVHIQRYSLRLDGLGSIHASYGGGVMTTKPIRCPGGDLALNYSTSAAGQACVEVLDVRGQVIPGFSREECVPMIGDEIEGTVRWKEKTPASLNGQTIRLRFHLQDADLYALRFAPRT